LAGEIINKQGSLKLISTFHHFSRTASLKPIDPKKTMHASKKKPRAKGLWVFRAQSMIQTKPGSVAQVSVVAWEVNREACLFIISCGFGSWPRLMAKPSLPTVTCLAIGSSWFPGSQAVIARHFAKAQDLRATGAPWNGLVQPHQQMEL